MSPTVIQTRYAGCHFRSRLEARWAVFFSSLDIPWEYEPEAFALPSGNYLPDFRLNLSGGSVWFEVKHENFLEDDDRWVDLSADSAVYVSFGIPRGQGVDDILDSPRGNGRIEVYANGTWDNFQAFCVCPECSRVGIEFEGRGARVCPEHCGNDDRSHTYEDRAIVAAYMRASSMRFEGSRY